MGDTFQKSRKHFASVMLCFSPSLLQAEGLCLNLFVGEDSFFYFLSLHCQQVRAGTKLCDNDSFCFGCKRSSESGEKFLYEVPQKEADRTVLYSLNTYCQFCSIKHCILLMCSCVTNSI